MGPGRPSPVSRVWAAGLGIVLGLVAHTYPALGHDVWLEPASFRPTPGRPVGIEVVVGESFEGESVPRNPERILDFWFGDGRSAVPVRGVAGASPAGVVHISPQASGWRLVRYLSRPATIELSARRFERHLRREGLGRVLADAGANGLASEPIREEYSRCAGALLKVGAGAFELPPNPRDCVLTLWPSLIASGGGELQVRLDLAKNGDPVADAGVRAFLKGEPDLRIEARTDVCGAVEFSLPRAGIWLFRAIHMERVADDQVDWRSWWASLTLQLDDG